MGKTHKDELITLFGKFLMEAGEKLVWTEEERNLEPSGKPDDTNVADNSRLKGNNKRLSEENYKLRKDLGDARMRIIFLEGELIEARAMVEELRTQCEGELRAFAGSEPLAG